MYKHNRVDDFASDWQDIYQQMTSVMRQLVCDTVDRHASDLASLFYNYMEADKEASPFLTHDLVTQRLYSSMQGWLRGLFSNAAKKPERNLSIPVPCWHGACAHPDSHSTRVARNTLWLASFDSLVEWLVVTPESTEEKQAVVTKLRFTFRVSLRKKEKPHLSLCSL